MRLPVIVGMGGVNAAGRTSGFQSFRRMVIDVLPEAQRRQTLVGLAVMMGLVAAEADGRFRVVHGIENTDNTDLAEGTVLDASAVAAGFAEVVCAGTLVRRVAPEYFNVDALHWQSNASLSPADTSAGLQFAMPLAQVPEPLPEGWSLDLVGDKEALVTVVGSVNVKLDNQRDFPVKAAGQLPSGFAISELYNSRFQPRGLQMALFGATDALRSVGIEWKEILRHVNPDQVGVYSSSGFGQMDQSGYGGMQQSRMKGDRVTTKALVMGINSMPTDFINAYVLANVGIASSSVAACATFLSNLRIAVADIQAGKVRVAMVGNSEAPIVPELMDGFATMGALATDENMIRTYGDAAVDHRRASRPFGENCGFTMGEASQYFVLMDDALAVELGAPLLGSITDVFIDADGIKKSITAPGPGNHITMAKAAAAVVAVAGEEALRSKSFVLAHGSSTPQNRVTESQIFDQVAAAFEIEDWPVVAVKAYVGHTIAPASGDQLVVALGAFVHGILPGIPTIEAVADDVHQQRLLIGPEHVQRNPEDLEVAILNSKGFGGNNASAVVLSPARTQRMLERRYSAETMAAYYARREISEAAASAYFLAADRGDYAPIYRFGEGMIADEAIVIDKLRVTIDGLPGAIELPTDNPYADMS
ncbi:beta-ketoacyl synthase [Halieaceae bacterium IMCC14734]|uniref:Beta-ketoacyl synthase n=1 Tax=Candidatus Litorirhabdus singularis TaxID=2518993 RepID=A0ABT3TL97_9GAMM|nr:beta-ketoacyl synthase [Candidatus Litorirhabdus singularis]